MDVGEQASRAYRIHAFPTMFVVDRKGIVRKIDAGSEALDPSGVVKFCSLIDHK